MNASRVNPNIVKIPTVNSHCFKSEFDSTYPIHLNGIIGQGEFQESIENINRAISSRKLLIIFGFLSGTLCLAGVILFIAGGITAATSQTFGFPVLVGVGIALFTAGILVGASGAKITRSRYTERMQRAIAHESWKYSMRTPTPCSWRLESSRISIGRYRHRRRFVLIYRIVIEIGRSRIPANGNISFQNNRVSPQWTSLPLQPDNSSAPPPPYNPSAPPPDYPSSPPPYSPSAPPPYNPSAPPPYNSQIARGF